MDTTFSEERSEPKASGVADVGYSYKAIVGLVWYLATVIVFMVRLPTGDVIPRESTNDVSSLAELFERASFVLAPAIGPWACFILGMLAIGDIRRSDFRLKGRFVAVTAVLLPWLGFAVLTELMTHAIDVNNPLAVSSIVTMIVTAIGAVAAFALGWKLSGMPVKPQSPAAARRRMLGRMGLESFLLAVIPLAVLQNVFPSIFKMKVSQTPQAVPILIVWLVGLVGFFWLAKRKGVPDRRRFWFLFAAWFILLVGFEVLS